MESKRELQYPLIFKQVSLGSLNFNSDYVTELLHMQEILSFWHYKEKQRADVVITSASNSMQYMPKQ